MKTRILHTVNSGLYFYREGIGCLCDGLHSGKEEGFSAFLPALEHDLKQKTGIFSNLHILFFTHLHPDHFDRTLLQTALSVSPDMLYITPKPEMCNTNCEFTDDGMAIVRVSDNITIYARKTIHDGAEYAEVPHNCYLVVFKDEAFFIAGDARLHEEDAFIYKKYSSDITAAFVNVFQISSPERRQFIEVLQPQRLFLNHLPQNCDDKNGLYMLANLLTKQLCGKFQHIEPLCTMEWID